MKKLKITSPTLPKTLSGKISLALGILFTASLIPLLILGFYNHPVGDDFTYGLQTHLTWEATHSLWQVLKTAVETSRSFWHNYQGPFVSAFFMALQPAVISERLYPLTTFIMLGALIISTFFFLKTVFRRCYGIPAAHFRIIAFVLLALCIQVIPQPSEAFYWFCGSVHYIFMHSLMLLLFAFLILWVKDSRKSLRPLYFSVSCLLAFLTGGANFVTGLLTLVLFCCFFAFCLYYKEKSACALFFPFVFYLASFYLCITAPGNSVRQADVGFTMNVFSSIYQAFRSCIEYLGEWNNLYFLLAIVFLLPVIWSAASQIRAPFPLPGLVLLASFCVLSASFAPIVYGLGTAVIFERTLNIIVMSYYLLVILNLFYLTGWLQNRLRAYDCSLYQTLQNFYIQLQEKLHKSFLLVVSACLVFLIFCTYHQDLTTKSAVHDLAKGYAQTYHEEVLHRIALLSMEGVDEVWVPNYSVRPHLLDLEDIKEDSSDWRNQATAKWYDKKAVHLSVIY